MVKRVVVRRRGERAPGGAGAGLVGGVRGIHEDGAVYLACSMGARLVGER